MNVKLKVTESVVVAKRSGKLKRLTPSFGCILAVPLKYFFRNKTFLFLKLES